jgi:heparan-alpha-glucosaminide N-acetyltransferase
LTDVWHRRLRAFPLVVIGMNSIAACMIAHLFVEFLFKALPLHLGRHSFEAFGALYEPFVLGATVLRIEWLILWWMYQRRIFLRV